MKPLSKILFVLALLSFTFNAEGQIKVDLKKKLENQVNRRLNQKADRAIDKSLDTVEDSIAAGLKKDDTADQPAETKEGQENKGTDTKAGSKTGGQQTALESYSKYDFIPGEKVIFYEDFSQDAVGDFPALWNTNGSAEVVTTNLFPGNWMKFVMNECVWTDALLKLPDNYTIEFDVIPIGGLEGAGMSGWHMRLMQAKNEKAWDSGSAPGQGGFHFQVEYFGRPSYNTWLYGTECEQLKLNGYVEGDQYKEKDKPEIPYCHLGPEIKNPPVPGSEQDC